MSTTNLKPRGNSHRPVPAQAHIYMYKVVLYIVLYTCMPLPSNQRVYTQIAGYQRGVDDRRVVQ